MVNKMFHAQNRNNIPQYTTTGFNGIVTQMLLHENKLLCIGVFTTYRGVPANKIIRLKLNGDIDYTFNTGTGFTLGEPIRACILNDDSIVLTCSGYGNIVEEVDYNLTPSDLGKSISDPDAPYISTASVYNGQTVSNVFKINKNGSFNTNINNNIVNYMYNFVSKLSDDTIICTMRLYESPHNSTDNDFNVTIGAMFDKDLHFIRTLVVSVHNYSNSNYDAQMFGYNVTSFSNDEFLISFTVVALPYAADMYIRKFNSNGVMLDDSKWKLYLGIEQGRQLPNNELHKKIVKMVELPNTILIGGYFETYAFKNTNTIDDVSESIECVDKNGVIDTTFNNINNYPYTKSFSKLPSPNDAGLISTVHDFAVINDTYTIAVGNFKHYQNGNAPGIAVVNNNTGALRQQPQLLHNTDFIGLSEGFYSIVRVDDNNIYLAGYFNDCKYLNGVNHILKMDILGNLDTSFTLYN